MFALHLVPERMPGQHPRSVSILQNMVQERDGDSYSVAFPFDFRISNSANAIARRSQPEFHNNAQENSKHRVSAEGKNIMCGPSGQETAIAGQQQDLSTLLSSNFSQRFGQQSAVLQNLNNMLTPLAQAGPDQQGFGASELAALGTQAAEGVGANYSKATQALQNTLAARGGGSEVLPTGARAALQGTLASSAADQMSKEQLGITEANYGHSRKHWQDATASFRRFS